MHCLVYQIISTPDGLMFYVFGLIEGKRRDLTLQCQSQWENVLANCFYINDHQFYTFEDSVYELRTWMIQPFIRPLSTPEQLIFKTRMSSTRLLVENNYRTVKQMWEGQEFARILKFCPASVEISYRTSAIMLEFRIYLYSLGQTAERFKDSSNNLDEYINTK